jgi:hypothetical protein
VSTPVFEDNDPDIGDPEITPPTDAEIAELEQPTPESEHATDDIDIDDDEDDYEEDEDTSGIDPDNYLKYLPSYEDADAPGDEDAPSPKSLAFINTISAKVGPSADIPGLLENGHLNEAAERLSFDPEPDPQPGYEYGTGR